MHRFPVLAFLSLAACGGGTNLQQFTGTWKYAAGASLSYHCPSEPAQFFDLQDGTLAIFEDGGALVATRNLPVMQPPCAETFDVQGNVATAQMTPPCSYDAGFLPAPIELTFTTDVLTISVDQKSMSQQAEGSGKVIGVSCPAAIAGTLDKE